jgi:hypothetical protein
VGLLPDRAGGQIDRLPRRWTLIWLELLPAADRQAKGQRLTDQRDITRADIVRQGYTPYQAV